MFRAHILAQTRKPSRSYQELDTETLHKCAMSHYTSFDGRWVFFLEYSTVFRGSNGIQAVFRSSLHSGTPENRHYNDLFFMFSQTSCRCIIQRKTLQTFVTTRLLTDALSSFSCHRRPKNAIFVLKSSSSVCGFTVARQHLPYKLEKLHAVLSLNRP